MQKNICKNILTDQLYYFELSCQIVSNSSPNKKHTALIVEDISKNVKCTKKFNEIQLAKLLGNS
jgi:hypothetical protein